jgi:7,8-dihydropterin-6-yl-methyl-4-(beta-D-ribofuranosyl)aminobenzene 5'-phosphate synthase
MRIYRNSKINLTLLVFVIILLFAREVALGNKTTGQDANSKTIEITVLYDNYTLNKECTPDWGFACIIEGTEKCILFDAGARGNILLENMDKLDINAQDVDLMAISHNHGDHIGGALSLLARNSNLSVYLPPSVPAGLIQNIKATGAKIRTVNESMRLCEHVHLTGPMGGRIIEQSIILQTSKGLVVITGCAHPGIVQIVQKAKEILQRDVYFVFGGFHLLNDSDSQVISKIRQLQSLGVKKVGATHCTGDRAIELFRQEYGKDFIPIGVGKLTIPLERDLNADGIAKDQLPPGLAYLNQAPAGHDFDAFFQESTVESELFRRRLLAGKNPNFINTDLVAEAILKFRKQAPQYLGGHKDLQGFNLSKKMIIKAISGKKHISSSRAYGRFTGRWYGLWDKMKVDHHWSEITEPDKPLRVLINGDKPVWIRSYQYCWVGDGYGLNMIATENPYSQTGDFLLGYVIHIENGDITRPTKRRPHVGIFVDDSKLIWITAGEVFLEEIYEASSGVEAYAITGFFYKVRDKILQTTQCFQAIYTRKPDNRPKWFSFPLKLQVSH